VLDNLIANALAHGGGPVELRASAAGDAVAISVRDHGPGYPAEFLPRAFERFSQANPSASGSGLGLSIAEAVVRAQGGTIAAANDPAGGAVVTFTLPAA
jgi:two-component system sensor histidine kinase MtrB